MQRPEHARGEAGGGLTYAARFSPGLLDPLQPTPAFVSGPGGKRADKRYNVYRNNVTVSLIEALGAVFPAVRRITGEDFFRAVARAYVRARPPSSPLLFEYGRDFPDFIAAWDHAAPAPWLADVARLERAWLDAYHAADAAPLEAQALAAVPAERLADIVFVAHPAARVVRSPFAAVTIFAAHRQEGQAQTIDAGTPEDALVTRPGLTVAVRHLPAGGAVFAARLLAGAPFATAASEALAEAPGFDLAANLAGLLAAGAFTSIIAGDGR
ncbi:MULTISPECIES: DNA-binding domain-containing protein [Chelatococcus]|uniref:Putative DNA-binding domain-containing protein n=1 Tax=Chelatococcus caeni TaxID=1348468 RepID=A0A840C5U4_9HYPH|nr:MULTISPECIES: DNA-binding domain-containing protein [Chelatococcus]ALA20555.1 hypothetical protein AL346_21595 [Chelatococcus sp. CO-6]MBB4018819.1 hypothetical protein [Chelatococcus caeni]